MLPARRPVLLALSLALALALPAAATYPNQTVLSGTPTASSSVSWAEISPDGNWVVFAGNLRDKGTELWSLPLDGSTTTPIRLTNTPAAGGNVWAGDIEISPDSRWVVTTGDLEVDEQWEVYSVPIDTGGQQLRLSEGNGRVNSTPRISPDSTRVVYLEDLNAPNVHELFSAPIRAADSQVTLSTTVVSEGDVVAYAITPDSQSVVYRGDLTTTDREELFRAPIDTAGGQVTISQSPPTGRVVGGPWVSPDGAHVVYRGDLTVDEQYELYARSLSGAGPQVRIGTSAVGGGDVSHVAITPDSQRVVFAGDLVVDEVDGVFSAPIDAAGQQIPLSGTGPGGAEVSRLEITPDGTRTVYVGDLRQSGVREVFAAPVDASGQQVRLTFDPVAGGAANTFQIAPDSTHVLVTGDLREDGRRELFLTPIDRAGGQELASGPAPVGAQALDVGWAPDGSRIIFTGDYDGDEVNYVYSVAVDAPGQRTRVSEPPIAGGDVRFDTVRVAPDSSFVLYVGDLLTDEVPELFASGAGQQPARAPTGVRASNVTETTARIAWERPWGGSQVTSYEVTPSPSAAPSSGPRQAAVTVGPSSTSTTLTGLRPGTQYVVSVAATNDAGASTPGTVTFTTAGDAIPEPPPGDDGVERLSGDNRYATAAAVALDRFDPSAVDTVYLATGANFPDALAGGPLAAADGAPILLTTPDALPDVTADAIRAFSPERLVLLGGTAAISEDVRIAAAVAAGMSDQLVERIAGDNRYATAAAIASRLPAGDTVYLATGTNFPDALTGGAATGGAPILLTLPDALPSDTAGSLAALDPDRVMALGGAAAVSDGTLATAGTAAGGAATGRLSGPNRFATATAVADTLPTPDTIYVAVGSNFPDALAGGPAASAELAPILLVTTDAIPDVIATWIDDLPSLRRIVILGGEGAISTTVEERLRSYLGQ